MSTTRITVTPFDALTILKLLAVGESVEFAVSAAKVPAATVAAVAQRHGYPDTSKLKAAAVALQERIEVGSRAEIPAVAKRNGVVRIPDPKPVAQPHREVRAVKPAAADERPKIEIEPDWKAGGFEEILQRAEGSAFARTRALGLKIHGLLADLEHRLVDEEHDRECREESERAAREAAEQVERLQAELAAAKERVREFNRGYRRAGPAKPAKPSTQGLSYTAVRAYARQHGIPCADRGKPSKAALDAYREAHQ